jgi:hypothetical protein
MHLLTGLLVRELVLRLGRSKAPVRSSFELVHATPGRLRVRLQNRSALGPMGDVLRQIPGVIDVSSSARTGSLVIRFDEGASGVRKRIVEALNEAAEPSGAAAEHGALTTGSTPLLRAQVQSLLARADARLLATTHGAVDVETLLGLVASSVGAKTLLLPGRLSRWNGLVLLHWGYGLLRKGK